MRLKSIEVLTLCVVELVFFLVVYLPLIALPRPNLGHIL